MAIDDQLQSRDWNGGALVIGGLGVVLTALYFGYVYANNYYLRAPVWLFSVSFVIMLVLSISLFYGGYWLAASEFVPDEVWRVTIWCFVGIVGTVSMTFWPVFYQGIVGVTIEDPVFILIVSAGIGADAGLLIGVHNLRSRHRLREVEQSRDAFEFLNRLLRHNVLNAVHVIQGYADLLGDGGDPAEVDEYVRKIRTNSERITDLVGNAKVLVQRVDGERTLRPMDLSALVADELDALRTTYDAVTIESDLQDGVEVLADELLGAAVENVVTNAVEHNDRDAPEVAVTLATRDDVAVLRIADNGPGIPDELEADAFDPGEHGEHGIGLYLTRTLVTDYGGEIGFDDNEPRGTVVTLELPLAE